MCEHDILQVLPNEDILNLRDIYKQYFPSTTYVYNFLNSAVNWKTRCPNQDYITVMAPYGNWKRGTFVAVLQCSGYEVFICTLDKDSTILQEIIVNTKKIKWNKRMLVYAVHKDHHDTVLKSLQNTKFALLREIPCNVWWMPWKDALQLEIDCGPEVYVSKLQRSHAGVINSHWPHNFAGSEHYVAFIIEMNGGYGIFAKSSNELVAWILRIQIGLGMLHVPEQHKRKGYGVLVTKAMAKEIAREGINPLATVLINNDAAQAMFEKIGFQKSECIYYIESKEEPTYEQYSFVEKSDRDNFSSVGI